MSRRPARPGGVRRAAVRACLALACVLALAGGCVPAPPPFDARADDLAALAPLDLAAADSDALLRRAREVTVRVRVLGCDRLGVGSGVVLPGGIVVTNRHVVGSPRTIAVSTWDGVAVEAVVDGIAVDSDLAVLRLVDASALAAAEPRPGPAVVGEDVIVVGYPEGGPSTISTGRVLAVQDGDLFGEASEVLVMDAPVRSGNSGGPVLDAEGRVIGVVFARDPERELALAVPIGALLERLGRLTLAPPAGC